MVSLPNAFSWSLLDFASPVYQEELALIWCVSGWASLVFVQQVFLFALDCPQLVAPQMMAPDLEAQLAAPVLMDPPGLAPQLAALELAPQLCAPDQVAPQLVAPELAPQLTAPELAPQLVAPQLVALEMAPQLEAPRLVAPQLVAPELAPQLVAPELAVAQLEAQKLDSRVVSLGMMGVETIPKTARETLRGIVMVKAVETQLGDSVVNLELLLTRLETLVVQEKVVSTDSLAVELEQTSCLPE
jgi:hypothetical protein